MPSVRAGVVGAADLNRNDYMMAPAPGGAGPSKKFDLSQPATWSKIWFMAAVGYLAGMAFAAGGFRGSAGL